MKGTWFYDVELLIPPHRLHSMELLLTCALDLDLSIDESDSDGDSDRSSEGNDGKANLAWHSLVP